MRINKLSESRNLNSIREMLDTFEESKLELSALEMRLKDGSYEKYTYGELRNTVRAIGNTLLRMGIKKEDKIGFVGENRNEWILSYLAITYIGAIAVPYDILLKPEELTHIVKASDAIMILTSSGYLDRVLAAKAVNKDIQKIILFDDDNPEMLEDFNTTLKKKHGEFTSANATAQYAKIEKEQVELDSKKPMFKGFNYVPFTSLIRIGDILRARGENLSEKTKVDPDDIASLIFTSGTTGLPKGVMLTHKNLINNADSVQMAVPLDEKDVWFNLLPLHHTYPSMLGIFVPLIQYSRIIPVGSLKSTVFMPIMKETSPTAVPSVPALIEKIYSGLWSNIKKKPFIVRILVYIMFGLSKFFRMLNIPLGKVLFRSVRKQMGLLRLRFFVSGGGPIPKGIIDGMDTFGLTVMQGYGLTETSPVASTTSPKNNRVGSVGLPLVNCDVTIEQPDELGNGEILIRGVNLMKGYYNQPEETAKVIDANGWFHTGDIGHLDKDGFLYITGRMKNVIITKGGKNIYPEEIENKLLMSEYIAEAVILPNHDPEKGELPHAIVYPNFEAITAEESLHNKKFTNEEIDKLIGLEIRKATHGMANYKIPRSYEISPEELPKTSKRTVKRYMFKK